MSTESESVAKPGWCEPDGCPSTICNGPHVSHHCPNGDLVTVRFDDTSPCWFCGWRIGEPCPAHGADCFSSRVS